MDAALAANMPLKDIPNWHDIVQANWRRTTAYLLALGEPCITMRDDELRAIKANRVLVGMSATDLQTWTPPGSWFMAVILCPGDDLAPLIDWATQHDVDESRIHFYIKQERDLDAFMAQWNEAGFATDGADAGITTWRELHHLFGLHLSNRILMDATAS